MTTKKQGYKIGQGRTFTPSNQATWIDAFNLLLDEKKSYSRNKLTEELIQDGLKHQNRIIDSEKGISIPMDQLSLDQVQLLTSKEGQQILQNVLRLVLGQGNVVSMSSSIQDNVNEVTPSEENDKVDQVVLNESKEIQEEKKQTEFLDSSVLQKARAMKNKVRY